MPAERVIKKYANRRLYDTKASRHVTLEEVRALIAAGESIKVVDDRTGDDITRTVLMQIIAEQEQSGGPLFTTAAARAAHPLLRRRHAGVPAQLPRGERGDLRAPAADTCRAR